MTLSFNELLESCKTQGLKMTPQRRWVLECLYAAIEPLTAYELLAVYRKAHGSGEAMTIYRALSYLEEKHLIHKIHSQNKYKLCDAKHNDFSVQLFLCARCREVREIHSNLLQQALNKTAQVNGFKVQESALELVGICKKCSTQLKHDRKKLPQK